MVTCKICKAQFEGDGTQGWGCAASVYQKDGSWYVTGHYGSRLFDMNCYKFVDPKNESDDRWLPCPTENTDPVCDVCISVWLRLERILWIKDGIL
jgi:hypothetical protein